MVNYTTKTTTPKKNNLQLPDTVKNDINKNLTPITTNPLTGSPLIKDTPVETIKPPKTTPSNTSTGKPIFIKDDPKGKTYSLKMPNGEILKNLKPDIAFQLRNGYKPSQQEQIAADYNLSKEKTAYAQSQEQPNVTNEQLSQLGTLTPEQQAYANSNADLPGNLNINRIGAAALEKGVAGAIGGATVGSIGGPAGALLAGSLAAVGGTAWGTFATLKDAANDNVAGIDRNILNAKYNLNSAAIKARKGAPYELIKQIEGDNIAALMLAERQYKEQSKHLFDTKSKKKMEDLKKYMDDVLPGVQYNIAVALQNPNTQNMEIDYGLDENGTPIDPTGDTSG
jgi:hypothetical protein